MLLVYSNEGFDLEIEVHVELRKLFLCNLCASSGSENTGGAFIS